MQKKPKPTRKPKPRATRNAVNGNVRDSAFVVGENNGIVINGGVQSGTQDERISEMLNRILDEGISDFENKYNTGKE